MNSDDPLLVRADQQKAEIEKGRMMAKAVIKKADGSATVVAVYEASIYHKFYFIYELRRARSPRRLWKRVWTYGIFQGQVLDLAMIVTRVAMGRKYEGCKITFKYTYGKRRFKALIARMTSPVTDLPARPASDWYLVEKMNKKFQSKIKGRSQ